MKKGFTLLELLIVIAILAVLATVVVLVLNPAEYLRQSRDAQRLSDMDILRDAINLYLTDVANPDLTVGVVGAAGRCTVGIVSPFTQACTTSAVRTVDGAGWVLVDFRLIGAGSPLTILPLDPLNNATNYYAYAANDVANTYEIDANLESTKYTPLEGTDGGNNATWYEVGNFLTM